MTFGLDTSVVMRLLTGEPHDLATKNLATANPGFVGRMIHAEYNGSGFTMLTCESAAKSLPGTTVIHR